MVDVSVVVPVYNGEKTIKKTIEALLSQKTEKSYEIIVVDDGSTDDTPNVIKNYPIKVITQKNAGPSAARNTGWKAASAEIVAFTDSDCIPVPDWIEVISNHFEKPSVGGVGGTYETENTGSILATYIGEDIRFRHARLGKEIEATGTFSAAFRKKSLEQIGGFDETYKKATAEDFDLCFAIRKTGHKIIYEPKAIVGHYHKESFFKYIKTQFWFSVWRVYLYNKYRNMAKGDQYTPITTLIQVPIALLFLASLVSACFIEEIYIIPIFFMGVLVALTIPFIRYEMRKNPLIAVMGLFVQLIRNIVWAVGFICGLVNLVRIHKISRRMYSDTKKQEFIPMRDNQPPTRTIDLKTTKLLVIHDPFGSIADFDKAGFLFRVLQQYRVLSKEFELIFILTCDTKKWDIFPPNVHHVPFFDIPFRKILFILFSGILRLRQVDIVEVDGPLAIFPALIYKLGGARIFFYHRWDFAMSVRDVKGFPYTVLANLVQKIAFKVADVIAATTQELAEDARKNCHGKKKVYLLPNYVDIEQFKPLSEIKRPNLLVFVGRLHKQKNVRLLMDAMQYLPQYKLWIIGDGPLKKPLFMIKERSGLNNVEFLGRIENNVLPMYLNQAEVFILLSPREGHPKALLEAMACGLPCIGSNSRGIRNIITPGETGLICEPTVESVVNTIKKIFSNRREMFKMGKNAMEFVRGKYSGDSILRYKIEIYREVLGSDHTQYDNKNY